jgi:hypothetical protein
MSKTKNIIWHSEKNPNYPQYINFDFNKEQIFQTLFIKSQPNDNNTNEHKRSPKNFVLEGYSNNSWNKLLEVNNALFTKGNEWLSWRFTNNQSYKKYRLVIKSNNGDSDFLTISKIKLLNTKSENINFQDNPILIKSINKINIVHYKNLYYAIPQSLGTINLEKDDIKNFDEIIIKDDLDELESLL